MKLWQAEKEAFDAMEEAKTLADFVRIGFNAVHYKDYVLWEMVGGNKVSGEENTSKGMEYVELDGDIPVELNEFTTDDLGFHVVYVKDSERENNGSN